MPELPEVETIRLGLQQAIIGQTIKDIQILLAKMFSGDPSVLISANVTNTQRRGKLLIIDLVKNNEKYHLLVHLKMTGQLIFQSHNNTGFGGGHPIPPLNSPLPNKSTKVIITFQSGDILYFNDLRTFGYMRLVRTIELHNNSFLQTVGIEPLTPEFSLEKFTQLLAKKPKANIKAFLLDQTHIAGLGNIYTDEALFRASILPWRLINSLADNEIQMLHASIRKVLQSGIELQGASQTSYVNLDGKKGTFLDKAAVYQRQGKPCPTCGNPIQKTKWAGRGTHYCAHCQK